MLPKENRLKKSTDFDRIYKAGRFFSTKFINLKYLNTNLPVARVGFVVGTKVHKKATKRNLLKRRMREVIRLNLEKIKKGVDIAITARAGATGLEYREIERDIVFILKKTGLIPDRVIKNQNVLQR